MPRRTMELNMKTFAHEMYNRENVKGKKIRNHIRIWQNYILFSLTEFFDSQKSSFGNYSKRFS